MYMKYMFFEVK